MNSLQYGTSPYMPLEIEQVIETKRIRKGLDEYYERYGESLLQLRDTYNAIEYGNRSLEDIYGTTGRMAHELDRQSGTLDRVATGLDDLNSNVSEGFYDLSNRLDDGFERTHEELMRGNQSLEILNETAGVIASELYDTNAAIRQGNQSLEAISDTADLIAVELHETNKGIHKGNQSLEIIAETTGLIAVELHETNKAIHRGNQTLESIDRRAGEMTDELRQQNMTLNVVASGVQDLNVNLREGVTELSDRLANIGWGIEQGFGAVALELQNGFEAVVTGLAIVDKRLGQRLAAHFSALQTQLGAQHEELLTTLDNGFRQVKQAVLISAEYLGNVITAAAQAQMRQMAQEGEAIRRTIKETGQQQLEKLEDIHHALLHQEAHKAEEHFVVGMNDFNHGDLRRAYLNFRRAERMFGGHFPTLFMLGFTDYLMNDLNAALRHFRGALSQAAARNPAQTAKQRGLASLYMARLYFTAKQFETARTWYKKAFEYDPNFIMPALVEGAAARLLAPDHDIETIVKTIKADFKECGQAAQHLYWYALALTLTPLDAEWASATFGMGVKLDKAGGAQRDCKRVLATLRWLNARHVDALLALVKPEYSWLG